jgi:thiol-disulfide isomerase/thioredoxin
MNPFLRLQAVMVLGVLLPAAGAHAADDEPPSDEEKSLPWIESLDDGLAQAAERQAPVLVRFGARWCGWCGKLADELPKPEVQSELARWTLVYVDVDERAEDAARMGVSSVPALRVLSPQGRMVGSKSGFMPADEMVDWLTGQFDLAADQPASELTAEGPASEGDIDRILKELGSRNPAHRELAVNRLAETLESAPSVKAALMTGKLQVRLSALEVLTKWGAPILGLDPWRPETFTPERLAALEQWQPPQPPAESSEPDGRS